MVLTVTEDTPADMLAGSMELLVQLPREHHLHTQRVTVQRSTPMMDLLVQIATAHKLAASSYTLQAIGERGMVLPHQPNTPIGALDALQVKLLPKQGTFVPRKTKQANQPFETTFRLQVHLPRNQLYVSRVSPKMNLGDILEEVCREKNLDKNKYELRHPANLEEVLDLSLSLQDYHLQEVTLYAKQGRSLGSALSSQDIMALQRQEERRRQQAKQGVFGFMFKKSKEGSLSTDSLGGRSASPARSDETGRSASPLQPPARPQRKRRPAPKPPTQLPVTQEGTADTKDKVVISHSRNSSDSSGYHEASVLSDNPDSAARLPETLPRRSRAPTAIESPRKLAHTSQSSKSLGNLATVSGSLSHATSSTSLSSTGLRKKRAAPPPPVTRPLSSAISTQALERIVDSEESLTSDMDPSKPPSDIGAPSKASSDIDDHPKASSDIGVTTVKASQMEFKASLQSDNDLELKKLDFESRHRSRSMNVGKSQLESTAPVDVVPPAHVESARVTTKRVEDGVPLPKPRKASGSCSATVPPKVPKRRIAPLPSLARTHEDQTQRPDESGQPEQPVVVKPRVRRRNASSKSDKVASLESDIPESPGVQNETLLVDDVFLDEGKQDVSKSESLELDGRAQVNLLGIDHEKKEDEESDRLQDLPKIEGHSFDNSIGETKSFESLEPDDWIVKEEISVKRSIENDYEYSLKRVQDTSQEASPKLNRLGSMEKEETELSKSVEDVEPRKLNRSKQNSKEKISCLVISTLPKCEHLDVLGKEACDRLEKSKDQRKNLVDQSEDPLSRTSSREEEETKETRRKIFRSVSKLNDFETNSLERQKRHLTADAEDITCALNLSVSSNLDLASDVDEDIKIGQKEQANLIGRSETDILLQKVSDTLSNSLPSKKEASPSPPPEPKIHRSQEKPQIVPLKQTEPKRSVERIEPTRVPDGLDIPDGTILNTSTPNMTLGSQQDTSDYVSAVGDDLSITDWEYQLPAPPSAFRDTNSPVFDGYDTITLRSVEAFKEPDDQAGTEAKETVKSSEDQTEKSHPVKESRSIAKEDKLEEKPKQRKEDKRESSTNRKANLDLELKKEMINELENKIGTLPQTMNKEHESRRVENASTPKIAPVDNTLSNFKIMTYTKQKSLNIFEEGQQEAKSQDDRFIKSFATLSRNRNNNEPVKEFPSVGSLQNKTSTAKGDPVSLNDVDASKSEPKMQEALHRRQPVNSGNEKTSVQRSKSYVSEYDNSKRRGEVHENEQDQAEEGIRKASSTMSFNVGVKNNEKFSQWRENILKRQEEPTKEKQLQSLQVLKSILPQLKNAQQAEESVPKEYNSAVLIERARPETASDEHSVESNVVPTRSSQKIESEGRKSEENSSKRYTYSGPPAISLGSWSERPSVNVQIKMDTDYKLGGPNKAFGKTVVSINGTKEEKPINNIERTMSIMKQEAKTENKQVEEPGKKVIPAAFPFKKPTLNKVNLTDATKNPDKPVVTGVELKKSFIEKNETTSNNENVIDTTPVNFKELTKAFGAEVCLRPKPKRLNVNRRSEGFETESGQRITESSRINGFPERLSVQEPVNGHPIQNGTQSNGKPRRFTSVVGINPQNQMSNGNFPFRGNVNVAKGNGPMPVVKGFKLQSSQSMKNETVRNETNGSVENCKSVSQPPKPPTMPVITGVTLKSASARSKSMPVQVDPRNVLLESIRNFGGRENLKSAAKRC